MLFQKGKDGFYCKYVKRALDVCCSSAAIVVLSPLMLATGMAVKVKLGSPVAYKQERIGKNRKTFEIIKFRTMTNARDESGKLLPDEQRITRLGQFLRKASIDELPELFCILKGDMSVVGPRPLPVIYDNYYTVEEQHRHDVRPGLSGIAQISGRNHLRWEEKFQFDLQYVNSCSFLLDADIVIKTINKVLGQKDVVTGDTVKIGDYISRPLNVEREMHQGV